MFTFLIFVLKKDPLSCSMKCLGFNDMLGIRNVNLLKYHNPQLSFLFFLYQLNNKTFTKK